MYRSIAVFAIIIVVAILGLWQAGLLGKTLSLDQKSNLETELSEISGVSAFREDTLPEKTLHKSFAENDWFTLTSEQIITLLENEQWQQAVEMINEVYSQSNSDQFSILKSIVFRAANDLQINEKQSAQTLLLAYAENFDDVDAWRQLGSVAADLGNWEIAVNALLASSSQEYEPQAYEASLRALLRAASYARATLEQRNDQLSVLALYQRLYDLHPNYSRFQLELAQAHLRLNDYQAARSYLNPLIYDSELGVIAQQLLANIDHSQAQQAESPANEVSDHLASVSASDITIPLVRAGNSLLVDVSINSSSIRLLLDTGASITALSSDTIRRLGLSPTGRNISLSTANGLTQSPLYKAEQLNLGRLRLTNLVVAEVDLGRRGQVEGLLGTDVLKQVSNQFSYLIDDQKNALIFRRTK